LLIRETGADLWRSTTGTEAEDELFDCDAEIDWADLFTVEAGDCFDFFNGGCVIAGTLVICNI